MFSEIGKFYEVVKTFTNHLRTAQDVVGVWRRTVVGYGVPTERVVVEKAGGQATMTTLSVDGREQKMSGRIEIIRGVGPYPNRVTQFVPEDGGSPVELDSHEF